MPAISVVMPGEPFERSGLTKIWHREAPRLSRLWNQPQLGKRLLVHVNPRLRATVARFVPRLGAIQVAPPIADTTDRALVREVLCHEAAHAVVFWAHPEARPHGEEWAQLMVLAGFHARPTFSCRRPLSGLERGAKRSAPRPGLVEHRCPVCQTIRFSPRPVSRWRCSACVRAGLEGRFVTTRLDSVPR